MLQACNCIETKKNAPECYSYWELKNRRQLIMMKRHIISSSVGLVLASGLILSALVTDDNEVNSESNESKQSQVEQSIPRIKKETSKLNTKPVVIEVESQKQPVLTEVSQPQQIEQKEITQVNFVQSAPIQGNEPAEDTAFQVVLPQEESPLVQAEFVISPAGPALEKSEVTEKIEEESIEQDESTAQLALVNEELENKVQAAEKAQASASRAQADLEEAQLTVENLSVQQPVVNDSFNLADVEAEEAEQILLESQIAEARQIAEEARIQAVAAQNEADAAVEEVSEPVYEEQVIIDEAAGEERVEMVEVLPENSESSIETASAKVELQALADEKFVLAKQAEADLQVKESALIDVRARLEESQRQLEESKNTAASIAAEEERLAAKKAVQEAEEKAQKEKAAAEKLAQEKAEAEARAVAEAEKELQAKVKKEAQTKQAADHGNTILDNAKQYQGVSYSWGGTTTAGMDCSGFTQKVYKDSGITIPRTTSAQKAAANAVNSPEIGDLVFFSHDGGHSIGHVGIYTGEGQFIGSQSSTGVAITSVNSSYWGPRLVGYGRY